VLTPEKDSVKTPHEINKVFSSTFNAGIRVDRLSIGRVSRHQIPVAVVAAVAAFDGDETLGPDVTVEFGALLLPDTPHRQDVFSVVIANHGRKTLNNTCHRL
jgi:hypothetical protein